MTRVNQQTSGADYRIDGLSGGDKVSDQTLLSWVKSEAWRAVEVTRDANNILTRAEIEWPDGSAGELTVTTKNQGWLAVDAFKVTHEDSGKTVTQSVVTRNSDGLVTARPEPTVA